MHIIIRQPAETDAPRVSALSLQLGYIFSEAETRTQIKAINESNNDTAYVATDENLIIGWIHAFYTIRLECASYCEIGGLVVDDLYKGKGIGRMLVEHVKLWSKEKGSKVLRVRSNVKRNDAHAFYENIGFEERKQQKVFDVKL